MSFFGPPYYTTRLQFYLMNLFPQMPKKNYCQMKKNQVTFYFFASMWISVRRRCCQRTFRGCKCVDNKHGHIFIFRAWLCHCCHRSSSSGNCFTSGKRTRMSGRRKIPHVLYSKNCFKCKNIIENILFIHAVSCWAMTSALHSQEKLKFCKIFQLLPYPLMKLPAYLTV